MLLRERKIELKYWIVLTLQAWNTLLLYFLPKFLYYLLSYSYFSLRSPIYLSKFCFSTGLGIIPDLKLELLSQFFTFGISVRSIEGYGDKQSTIEQPRETKCKLDPPIYKFFTNPFLQLFFSITHPPSYISGKKKSPWTIFVRSVTDVTLLGL